MQTTIRLSRTMSPQQIEEAMKRAVEAQSSQPWRPRFTASAPDGNGWDDGNRLGLAQISCHQAACIGISPVGTSAYFNVERTYRTLLVRTRSHSAIQPCPCHQELELDETEVFNAFIAALLAALANE